MISILVTACFFRRFRVDRRLNDGDKVELGGAIMVAHLTPGHTKGCTTWTTSVLDGGQIRQVVFVGSPTVPGYQLVENSAYPNIIADYERTFRVLKALPCDVFLGSHGSFFSLAEKIKRMNAGSKTNVFIDPQGYSRFVRENEEAFRKECTRQSTSSRTSPSAAPTP
jgi:metallo-beta-lactamase class B